jgi:hypothetical protein
LKDVYNGFMAIFISTLIFSLLMGGVFYTPANEREFECCYLDFWSSSIKVSMVVLPIYFVFGLLGAYLVDRLTAAFKVKKKLYLFQLLMYTIIALLPALFLGVASEDLHYTSYLL